jgi:hypothetical protein
MQTNELAAEFYVGGILEVFGWLASGSTIDVGLNGSAWIVGSPMPELKDRKVGRVDSDLDPASAGNVS